LRSVVRVDTHRKSHSFCKSQIRLEESVEKKKSVADQFTVKHRKQTPVVLAQKLSKVDYGINTR
jgi:hypothetical protein